MFSLLLTGLSRPLHGWAASVIYRNESVPYWPEQFIRPTSNRLSVWAVCSCAVGFGHLSR